MKDGYKVKICGTTTLEDAMLAAEAGADYLGVVIEVSFSPRSLTVTEAEGIFKSSPLPTVALVFEMPEERLHFMLQSLRPFAVQFLSQEEPSLIEYLKKSYPEIQMWQSVHLPQSDISVDLQSIQATVQSYITAGVDVLLFDTVAVMNGKTKFGGTGVTSDWNIVQELMQDVNIPVLLAGGINPDNTSVALRSLGPTGIDLCSGVEAYPGKKDPLKLAALMLAVKEENKRRQMS